MKRYLLVDGYNIINAWPRLKRAGMENLQEAREQLIEILAEYKSFTGEEVIIVFDAHLVKGAQGKRESLNGLEIIFTKEHQTADSYIERRVEELTKNRRNMVRVATSDWAEQQVVLGSGAARISARELGIEVEAIKNQIQEKTKEVQQNHGRLGDRLDSKIVEILEKWRRTQ
ncbi:NYN domain-containing protein [Thermotalea metallivorans]|uniref:NYN domain-containing protein n=1 Tax=Thermotalea metallivorans TaxID=520762 RepID=A0A140L2M7_9FIRM|nr:NYN domain-containing protein [Thermotalea metallivorans]KXG74802.1 hypothetical protein AN619_21430 [Thermotalea metallivorans]